MLKVQRRGTKAKPKRRAALAQVGGRVDLWLCPAFSVEHQKIRMAPGIYSVILQNAQFFDFKGDGEMEERKGADIEEKTQKVGLVVEGGAMRGMFTAGVMDVFLDHDFFPDAVMGVSSGAVFASSYISGQRGRVIRYSRRFNADKRYMGLGSLIKTGNYINRDFAYGSVQWELDPFDEEAFEKRGIPFYLVTTDIGLGEPVYVRMTNMMKQNDYLIATASMPFFSKPVKIDGREYLDGGFTDAVPYMKMKEMGYEKLIILLTREKGYEKKGLPPALVKAFYHKNKNLCHILINYHEDYNENFRRMERMEEAGELFVIRPPEALKIKRVEKDPKKLQMGYDLGVRTGEDRFKDLMKFLGKPISDQEGQNPKIQGKAGSCPAPA